MIGFLIGMLVGGVIGVTTGCACAMSGIDDRRCGYDSERENH